MQTYKLNVQSESNDVGNPPHPMRLRSTARRALLLDTIIELIAHEGVDAVTHRRVAARAGVPLGSTTYYFASRERMLVEALERFERQEIAALHDRLSELIAGRPSRRRYVQVLVDTVAPQLEEDRWRTVAQYTLMCESARRPELAPVVREWTGAWCSAVEKIFAALSATDPRREAATLVAMLDGFLLQQIAAPTDAFVPDILEPAIAAALTRAEHTPKKAVGRRQATR